MYVCPSLEPDARFLVCAKREWRCDNSGGFHGDGLKESQDVKGDNVLAAAVSAEAYLAFTSFLASVAGVSAEAFGFSDFLPSEHSVASTVTTLSSSLASMASLGGAVSEAQAVISRAKIFRSSPASDSPWRMATSVRKGGRRTVLRDCQSCCFFCSFEVAGGGAKKGLRDREANFPSFRSKGDLEVKGDHRRQGKVACEGEILKSFSEGLISDRRMSECELDFPRR